ncbi:MAG TPA: hypothetical protein VLY46_00945 [Usitatibacter sp.]|nr:hypothetical protein [Usitatibacter sp.]
MHSTTCVPSSFAEGRSAAAAICVTRTAACVKKSSSSCSRMSAGAGPRNLAWSSPMRNIEDMISERSRIAPGQHPAGSEPISSGCHSCR